MLLSVLLIYNGTAYLEAARKLNIVVFYLSSYTIHDLQPMNKNICSFKYIRMTNYYVIKSVFPWKMEQTTF